MATPQEARKKLEQDPYDRLSAITMVGLSYESDRTYSLEEMISVLGQAREKTEDTFMDFAISYAHAWEPMMHIFDYLTSANGHFLATSCCDDLSHVMQIISQVEQTGTSDLEVSISSKARAILNWESHPNAQHYARITAAHAASCEQYLEKFKYAHVSNTNVSYREIITKIEQINDITADPSILRVAKINIAYLREDFEDLYTIADSNDKLKKIAYILDHDIHQNLRFSFPSPDTYQHIKELLPYLEEENAKNEGCLATVNQKHIAIEQAEADMKIQNLREFLGVFDRLHEWATKAYAACNTGQPVPDPKQIIANEEHTLFKRLYPLL
ncbi:MAG: hypothetical protein ACQESG_05365 [Nanobdellota archaeon]